MILEIADTSAAVRPASPADRSAIERLLNHEQLTHRHMDWAQPLDWLGRDPYLIAQKLGRTAALLACPPDPPEVAWIRAFAVNSLIAPEQAWDLLWRAALQSLHRIEGVERALTIVMEDWYQELLVRSGFKHSVNIRMLSWENGVRKPEPPADPPVIRPMEIADLPAVAALDRTAFYPLWHHSLDTLQFALAQCAIATVSEGAGGITGYTMSTASPFGGHLARLAVHPNVQGRGIGYALLHDLLTRFRARGAMRVTVNTQENNHASLRLYRKSHFHLTGESYPVYEFRLDNRH
ncbi:MAG TPA: GNAT family N-acetyltransferase [Anaerolineales bacterium]|nr:GNAT family N-acetyltransferase [Anaerolineales bacterium]